MASVAAGGSRATQDPFVAKLRSSHDQLVRHGGRSLETIWGCDHSPDVLFPLTGHWVTPKGIDPITLKNIENHGKGWPSCSNLGEDTENWRKTWNDWNDQWDAFHIFRSVQVSGSAQRDSAKLLLITYAASVTRLLHAPMECHDVPWWCRNVQKTILHVMSHVNAETTTYRSKIWQCNAWSVDKAWQNWILLLYDWLSRHTVVKRSNHVLLL